MDSKIDLKMLKCATCPKILLIYYGKTSEIITDKKCFDCMRKYVNKVECIDK